MPYFAFVDTNAVLVRKIDRNKNAIFLLKQPFRIRRESVAKPIIVSILPFAKSFEKMLDFSLSKILLVLWGWSIGLRPLFHPSILWALYILLYLQIKLQNPLKILAFLTPFIFCTFQKSANFRLCCTIVKKSASYKKKDVDFFNQYEVFAL